MTLPGFESDFADAQSIGNLEAALRDCPKSIQDV